MRIPNLPPVAALCLAAACLLPGTAAAQGGDFAPPPDLTAPPADAVKSKTGLTSRMLSAGAGTGTPADTDIVTVHYTGWASDGRMFDSSISRGNPSTFPLDRVMAGWRECVRLMTVGEKRRCWVPQDLAYRGQAGRPTGMVVFDIELIDRRQSPMIPPPDVKEPPADARLTPAGVHYKVIRAGTGTDKPRPWSRVVVHYTGWTTDGKMFDSSIARGAPATFSLDGELIRGWVDGMQQMVQGEYARFWIPESLAYKGQAGNPRGMLVFDIELIRIE